MRRVAHTTRESEYLMKKLENIVKSLSSVSVNSLSAIIKNDNVVIDALSENEKFSVLIFAELEKALRTKEAYLTLDANYAQSKFHASEQYLVDYFRLVSNDTKNATMIQFYVSANAKKQSCKFHLCTSCARVNREQFEALENELHFVVKRDKKTQRAKTTERKAIDYTEIIDVVKAVCAVLANSRSASDSDSDSEKQ